MDKFIFRKTADISEILRRLELDAQLSGREFVEIKKVVQQGLNILRYFDEAENVEIPTLEELIQKFSDLSPVHKTLEIFDNSGSLYDNASAELMHIRSAIKRYQSDIKKVMQELLAKNAASLTENLITVRNDRQGLACARR